MKDMIVAASRSNLDLSVVIPIFQNSGSLTQLIARIVKVTEAMKINYEIIAIDDGSTDESFEILQNIRESQRIPLKIISLTYNFGQVAAIYAGLRHSKGRATVVISADLQDPPELIVRLYELFTDGHEVVIATRSDRHDPFLTKISSSIAYSFLKRDLKNLPKGGFDFFLVGESARRSMAQVKGKNLFLQGELLNTGYRPVFISYSRSKREFGRSAWTIDKRLSYFEDAIIDSARRPFIIMFRFGILLALLSFLLGVITIVNYFLNSAPFSGFTPLYLSILAIGGLQLALLSMLGQFVTRIYDVSRGRELFKIQEIVE
jgi:dolichol-phosphate mannosyltransferase